MSALASWGLLVLVIAAVIGAALLLGAILDGAIRSLTRDHDLDEVRRRDKAREALARIHGRRGGRA